MLANPAPSRVLADAYLQYYLQNPPHSSSSLRIHVFARAQDQYLFPRSISNKGKRVLPDNVLCKWWREILGTSATAVWKKSHSSSPNISLYYLLGGFTFPESLAVLSRAPEPTEASAPSWQYGQPYLKVAPPLLVPKGNKITINDLIPSFQDDPKARQMTEWASSPIPYAGQDGDYDEIAEEIQKLADTSPLLHDLRSKEIQEQKDQERKKLTKDTERDVEGFWEVMGNRGECASGHVAGFFVVVSEHPPLTDVADPMSTGEAHGSRLLDNGSMRHAVTGAPAALPHSTYIRLWSQIHNVDYSSIDKAHEGYARWSSDVGHACIRTGAAKEVYESHAYGDIEIDNASLPSLKRSDPPKQVNTLQVKKKKKAV